MDRPFDSGAIARLGWRQGAIFGTDVAERARAHAPPTVDIRCSDLLVVASHDCDVLSPSLDKEPFVEIVCGRPVQTADKRQFSGRNPRTLQFSLADGEGAVTLSCAAHQRWAIPRELLLAGSPHRSLPDRERRLLAEWLAKRYIRAAFPTAFDQRWRAKLKHWQKLLQRRSDWLQGVYLRLSTLAELPDAGAYLCHLIIAVRYEKRRDADWARWRVDIEREVDAFWTQFKPGISCEGVDVLGTDEITLADIESYQRFDADWVSYEDETAAIDLSLDTA